MKKPVLSFRDAILWNKLLRKYFRAFRRFEVLKASEEASHTEVSHLQRKIQSLFNRLSRMQSRVGIKIAGSAIALMLMSTQLNAQVYHPDGPLSHQNIAPFSMGLLSNISTGDVDGDGNTDIVVGEYFGTTTMIRNNGNGEFMNEGSIVVDGASLSIGLLPSPTLADVDEDGDLDLYTGSYSGTINVAMNDGNGVFTSAPDLLADGSTIDVGMFSFPEFADVDEDGDLDLYVGESTGLVKVFINNGSGVFTASGNLQAGGVDISAGTLSQPTFYDLDNDGDLDLYLGVNSGYIHYFSNNGSGVFTAGPDVQADASFIDIGTYSSPAFADINDDGFVDLISGNYDGQIVVFSNAGSGTLTNDGNLVVRGGQFSFGMFNAPSFADIDGDGDLDIFVGTYYGTISVISNSSNGNLVLGPNVIAAGVVLDAGSFVTPVFADIDGDNDMDLFVGNDAGYIVNYTNMGGGVFSAGVNVQADASDIDVGNFALPEFADLDNDGDLDLYVGNSPGNISVFVNDGSGVFAAAATPLFVADGITVDVGDLAAPYVFDIDLDGDLDMLVGEYLGAVKVYLNNGSGVFNSAPNLQVEGADIDNGFLAIPRFANIDGGCGPDLFVGGYQTPIYKYNYTDTLAPVITCPANFTYNLLQFQNNYTVSGTSLDPISASDNCNIESVLNDFNSNASLAGVDFPAGTETITWTVTDVDGNTATCTVDVTVNVFNAIDDLSDLGISMYPNPSTGIFSIENAQNFNILISDAFGKTIASYANVQDAKFEVDLTAFPAGVYFVTVSNETTINTARLVID